MPATPSSTHRPASQPPSSKPWCGQVHAATGPEVELKEIAERAWTRISTLPAATLTLLDLRGEGCTRLGAPTDAVHARNHAAGRAFAKAIHAQHADIEGLLYVSRLTGKDVYAVFDRGKEKLVSTGTGTLMNHRDLPDILKRHGIRLIR